MAHITVRPACYSSLASSKPTKKSILSAWLTGEDFQDCVSGQYINAVDATPCVGSNPVDINVRYDNDRKVVVIYYGRNGWKAR